MITFCKHVIEVTTKVLLMFLVISLFMYFTGSFIFFELLNIQTEVLWFYIRTSISVSFMIGVIYAILQFEREK